MKIDKYDTDHDGYEETWEVDSRGGIMPDEIWVDADGDGVFDYTFQNESGDHELESLYVYDPTSGGYPLVSTDEAPNMGGGSGHWDLDGDGYEETYLRDSDGDNSMDQEWTDIDGDGYHEHFRHDTDWDGRHDELLIDEDHDGVAEQVIDI